MTGLTGNGEGSNAPECVVRDFAGRSSQHHVEKMQRLERKEGALARHFDVCLCLFPKPSTLLNNMQELYAGIAIQIRADGLAIGVASNDGTFTVDFAVRHFDSEAFHNGTDMSKNVADVVIEKLQLYQNYHLW